MEAVYGLIWVKKKSNKFQIKKKEINNLLKKEIKKKINSIQSYRNFFKQINMNIKKIKKKLFILKKINKQSTDLVHQLKEIRYCNFAK